MCVCVCVYFSNSCRVPAAWYSITLTVTSELRLVVSSVPSAPVAATSAAVSRSVFLHSGAQLLAGATRVECSACAAGALQLQSELRVVGDVPDAAAVCVYEQAGPVFLGAAAALRLSQVLSVSGALALAAGSASSAVAYVDGSRVEFDEAFAAEVTVPLRVGGNASAYFRGAVRLAGGLSSGGAGAVFFARNSSISALAGAGGGGGGGAPQLLTGDLGLLPVGAAPPAPVALRIGRLLLDFGAYNTIWSFVG